jgi:hypothetical protein
MSPDLLSGNIWDTSLSHVFVRSCCKTGRTVGRVRLVGLARLWTVVDIYNRWTARTSGWTIARGTDRSGAYLRVSPEDVLQRAVPNRCVFPLGYAVKLDASDESDVR